MKKRIFLLCKEIKRGSRKGHFPPFLLTACLCFYVDPLNLIHIDITKGIMSVHSDVEMDNDESNENVTERNFKLKKNRILLYNSILNYYKGRSLTLDFILASKQPTITIPPDMRTHEALCKDIQGLHDDITLFQAMKKCLKLINCSLACIEVMTVNDMNFRRKIMNKIEGVIHFSRSLMKLYNKCYSESDLIKKMKEYSTVLNEYSKSLQKLKEIENSGMCEDSRDLEKAELYIYKINLMRVMKSILIGYISLNCPDLLRSVLQFKTFVRRDLKIDDFHETWDIGYAIHALPTHEMSHPN